jgi:hypothetical protein
MSHRLRTPHEDAGDTAVLASAQSPPDGAQFPGVDPGSGYDGKHDRIEPKRQAVTAQETRRQNWLFCAAGPSVLTINRQRHSRHLLAYIGAHRVKVNLTTGHQASITVAQIPYLDDAYNTAAW